MPVEALPSPAPEVSKDALLEWLGRTKTAARKVVSAYLKTMPVNVRMADPRLLALARFHPTRRLPAHGAVFVLCGRPPYNTKALRVEARSGSFVDLSWIKCLENLYGVYSRARNARANVLTALRNEAFHSKAMQQARAALGHVCARCGREHRRLVVDHDGKPFAQIVDEFLAANDVQLEALEIRGSRNGTFRLKMLGSEWRRFHDNEARLVGLCGACNLHLSSRGYRRPRARGLV